MSALKNFLSAMRLQAEVLKAADSRDAFASHLLNGFGSRGALCNSRIWTRQDQNKAEYVAWFADHPNANFQEKCDADSKRRDLRLRRMIGRQKLHPVKPLAQLALAVSASANTYAVISPLIDEALKAHGQLIQAWTDQHDYGELVQTDTRDWNEIEWRWERALEALDLHCTPETAPQPPPLKPEDTVRGLADSPSKGEGRIGPFGLLIDDQKMTVERQGCIATVDFSGNELLWKIFKLFARGEGRVTTKDEVAQVWETLGRGEPEPSSVTGRVSDIRKMLVPLNLDPNALRGTGWKLEKLKSNFGM